MNQTLFRIVLHDISNPLSVIRGTTKILLNDLKSDNFKEKVEGHVLRAERAMEQVYEIIQQTRDLDAITSG